MKRLFLSCVLIFSFLLTSSFAHAQAQSVSSLDPKTKAFLIICGYGTVGGALLGLASMAFGQESRAIAQGASLGLYAGILFGAYVIYTHNQDSRPLSEDPSSPLPYDDSFVPYNDGTSALNPKSINHWHASSWEKLQENNSLKREPAISWSWNF